MSDAYTEQGYQVYDFEVDAWIATTAAEAIAAHNAAEEEEELRTSETYAINLDERKVWWDEHHQTRITYREGVRRYLKAHRAGERGYSLPGFFCGEE